MKLRKLVVLIFMLAGCTTIQETGQAPAELVNTVKFSVSLYCESLHNIHRIVVRALRVIDPQWQSICEEYEDMKRKASEEK